MIEHVYRRVSAAKALSDVIVATDDLRIARRVTEFGGKVRLTKATHETGTDRLAEVAASLDCDVVVNVQGDEPLIPSDLVGRLAHTLAQRTAASIATACVPIPDAAEFLNPNAVKVVCDHAGYALYFSRAPIPYARDAFAAGLAADAPLPAGLPVFRHLGIYAYRAGFLRAYARYAPVALEQFEALEQLRALWHGHRIAVLVVEPAPPPGVDTPEDLEHTRRLFARQPV
jgi:3-deoxy-manno-octulosonate cytidylyltransferase (CMP-KDO synthetase)